MSLSEISKVKKDKIFKKWDILVYGILAAVIAAAFIAVYFTRDKSPLGGICVYVDNSAVFEYDFTDKSQDYNGKILNDCVEVKEESGSKLVLKISAHGGTNTLEIDRSGKVKVTAADCVKRDCTYMQAITDNSGIIYCSPHRLKIVPYNFNPDGGQIIM